MAEYNFTVNNFSLTTTWKRMVQSAGIVGYNILADVATKDFPISGITLADGESIKYVTLTASLSRSGTQDPNLIIQVNGGGFNGARKFSAEGVSNGSTWQATFMVKASGRAGQAGALNEPVSHSCTVSFSNVVLTVVTGTGNVFDGKISSLNEGDKISIKESNSSSALYTLVHHEYNTGKALIFRDTIYGSSRFRESASTSGYNGSVLDRYLTNTFYGSLPSTTTQFLQTLDYPIGSTVSSSSSAITINRTAATISAMESGLGSGSQYGSFLNYTGTVDNDQVYWTRQPVSGMSGNAQAVNANNSLSYYSVTNSAGVRPTLGISEDQLVRYSDSDGGYIFCSQCTAPSAVYINNAASDVTGLNSEANLVLSWSEGSSGYNAPVSGYAVWYSTSANGNYEIYGTTTETSMNIIAPKKGYQTYYFKVQTLSEEDIDYCNSNLSSTSRAVSTKNSNLYYYDGTRWLIGLPKYWNGSAWVEGNSTNYYNGSSWKKPT